MKNWDLSVKCYLCGKIFKDGRGLTSHLRNKHPEFTQLQVISKVAV